MKIHSETQLTIDEILIKNGVTHLSGKMHDQIIVSMNEFAAQESKEAIAKQKNATEKDALTILNAGNQYAEMYFELKKENDELKAIINLSRLPHDAKKPITVADLRDLERGVTEGLISYSRMVELLNERAYGFYKQNPIISTTQNNP